MTPQHPTSSKDRRYTKYSDFFAFYLTEHSKPLTRIFHYVGTAIEIGSIAAFGFTLNPLFLLTAMLGGYGFAWMSHAFVERNRPATFTYPFWSYVADHHMAFLAVTGRLKARVSRGDCHAPR